MSKAAKKKAGAQKNLKKPINKYYKVEGGKVRRLRRFCPVCGPGVFLAEHKDRLSCGRCGYTVRK